MLERTVQIRVDQCNGYRFGPEVVGLLQSPADRLRIERAKDRPVCGHSGPNLYDGVGERPRFVDLEREQVRPRLVTDSDQVAKAFVRNQDAPATVPLEERIGRQGRPHPDLGRRNRVVGPEPQQFADAL
jgi:hypothetical protein